MQSLVPGTCSMNWVYGGLSPPRQPWTLPRDTFTGIAVPCRAFSKARGSASSSLKHLQSSSYSECPAATTSASKHGSIRITKNKGQEKIENTPGDARSGVVSCNVTAKWATSLTRTDVHWLLVLIRHACLLHPAVGYE